ncbi:MAG: hypothetical protein AAF483_25165 [Planctomycetota bacterium]
MAFQPSLESGMKHRVYWITKRITQGQFATPERAAVLRDQGVTHVLNVGECGSIIDASDFGFAGIVDVPIIDLQLIPNDVALRAMDALQEMLTAPNSIAYIHCIAGQNRSPTILWLYFVACGVLPDEASDLIGNRSPDAVPGHGRLIDAALVANAKSHGESNYVPLSDQSVLEPAY